MMSELFAGREGREGEDEESGARYPRETRGGRLSGLVVRDHTMVFILP